MCSKHVCPVCGGKVFTTTAHVQEIWKVDENGNYIETVQAVQTTHSPDDDNVWVCDNCGAIAVIAN